MVLFEGEIEEVLVYLRIIDDWRLCLVWSNRNLMNSSLNNSGLVISPMGKRNLEVSRPGLVLQLFSVIRAFGSF